MFLLIKEHHASPISFLTLCRTLFYSEVLRFVLLRSISGLGPAFVPPTSLLVTTGSQEGSAPPTARCAAYLPFGCVEFCRGQCRYRSVPSVSSVSHFSRLVFFLAHYKKKSLCFSCSRDHELFCLLLGCLVRLIACHSVYVSPCR